MKISKADWDKYKNMLASISERAVEEMESWITSKGGYMYGDVTRDEIIEYAYALATKYGEASASLAAQMYDEVAEASGVIVPSAEVAETASYGEIAKAVNGIIKSGSSDKVISNAVGKYVKRAGQDTTLKNAERDGAQFAWVPSGDTCAFCITLASRGWQYMSKKAMRNGHAEHIHPKCDCAYQVRFDKKTTVEGYDPDKYLEMYQNAEGDTWQAKVNSMRRIQYQENKDIINKQKRIAYAKREDSLEMYRKVKNTGVYERYSELMSKKHVRGVVAEMGLDPKDVKYKIDRNKDLIGSMFMGHTSDDGSTITLYLDAFTNREQLVKTIGHENIHLNQVRKNGKVKSIEELAQREDEAVNSEEWWWKKYVKATGYRSEN